MEPTYNAMMEWMAEHDLTPVMDTWEYFLTDAEEEPDPAKWETRIVWTVTAS